MCSWHRFTLCCTKTCNKRQQWIYKSIAFYQCVREIHRRNKSAHSSNNNYEKSMRRRKRKSRNEHLTQKLSERKLCSRIRSDIIFLSSLFSLLFFHSLCVCVCSRVFFLLLFLVVVGCCCCCCRWKEMDASECEGECFFFFVSFFEGDLFHFVSTCTTASFLLYFNMWCAYNGVHCKQST